MIVLTSSLNKRFIIGTPGSWSDSVSITIDGTTSGAAPLTLLGINWGDGPVPVVSTHTLPVTLTHTYSSSRPFPSNGSYHITFSVQDSSFPAEGAIGHAYVKVLLNAPGDEPGLSQVDDFKAEEAFVCGCTLVVSVSSDSSSACVGSGITFSATAVGGTEPFTYQWTENGIDLPLETNDTLTVSKLSAGVFLYNCKITDSGGRCVDIVSESPIAGTWYVAPAVDAGDITRVCVNLAPFQLLSGTPAGGVWSGTGVTDNVFYPAIAGLGEHALTYIYTDANGCVGSDITAIIVYERPDITLPPEYTTCINAVPFEMYGAAPGGGTWSGTGIANNIFSPSVAGLGTHVLTYQYTDPGGCSNSATTNIVVNAAPVVSTLPLAPACINMDPYLLTGGTPGGGVWSGDAVIDNVFSPSEAGIGTHELIYTYTDGNGCSSSSSAYVTVSNPPAVEAGDDISVCPTADPFLIEGGTPVGGVWSGPGVTGGNTFEASITGPGAFSVIYEYTDVNGCSNVDTKIINVYTPPAPSISGPSSIVIGDTAVLSCVGPYTSYMWSPGGQTTYSIVVAPVTDTTYTVRVTDIHGCAGTASHTLLVSMEAPEIEIVSSSCNETVLAVQREYPGYQWYLDGILIPDATERTYLATESGDYTVSVIDNNGDWFSSDPLYVEILSAPLLYGTRLSDGQVLLTIANFDASIVYGWYVNGVLIKDSGSYIHSQTYMVPIPGIYTVRATNYAGTDCELSNYVAVLRVQEICNVEMIQPPDGEILSPVGYIEFNLTATTIDPLTLEYINLMVYTDAGSPGVFYAIPELTINNTQYVTADKITNGWHITISNYQFTPCSNIRVEAHIVIP